MAEQFIACPHCGKKIQLTEAFAHEIEERLRREFQAETEKKDKAHEAYLKAREKEFGEKLAEERAKVENRARRHAEEGLAAELKDLKSQIEEKSKQLGEARQEELKLRKRQRELEEKERDFELQVERTLDKERKKIWEESASKVDEERRFKDREKDIQLESMRKQIDELKRKAEQGSQQLQGEAQELELEDLLKEHFPFDDIEPIGKGVRGADVLQTVYRSSGKACGAILWECKRTKNWIDGWIEKLKEDQRTTRSDAAVIVSEVSPKGITRLGQINGVWITDFQSVVGLAIALRASLIQIAQARSALVGKNEKMEILYNYLSGPEFKQHVEGIIGSFIGMKNDLDAEKRAMEKIWAKREKQIERVIQNTTRMYGDLQGIIGASLPEIKILELPSNDEAEV